MSKLFSPYRIRFIFDKWPENRSFNVKERKTRTAIMDLLNRANHEIMTQNYMLAEVLHQAAELLIETYDLPFEIEDTRAAEETSVCLNFSGGMRCYKCGENPDTCNKKDCESAKCCGYCGKFWTDECKPNFT